MGLIDELNANETIAKITDYMLAEQKTGFNFEHIAVYNGAECQKCGAKFRLSISFPDDSFWHIEGFKVVKKPSIEFNPTICPLCHRRIISALEEN